MQQHIGIAFPWIDDVITYYMIFLFKGSRLKAEYGLSRETLMIWHDGKREDEYDRDNDQSILDGVPTFENVAI